VPPLPGPPRSISSISSAAGLIRAASWPPAGQAIAVSGFHRDGTAFSSGLSFTVAAGTTVDDLVNHLNNNVLQDATASFASGQIRITDNETGYTKSDIMLSYSGTGALTTPPYFEVTAVGGTESRSANIAVYDTQGGKHVLSAALVRTDTVNTWDIILTSITGDIAGIDLAERRVNGLSFDH
jgi:hypothetical protein